MILIFKITGVLLVSFQFSYLRAQENKPPNILLIMCDDEFGTTRLPQINTPNLDRLASQGVIFKTFFASPICTPARIKILSGKYSTTTRTTNHGGLVGFHYDFQPCREDNFARSLKTAGYATAIAGKAGWASPVTGVGFDEYCLWAKSMGMSSDVARKWGWNGVDCTDGASRFWQPAIFQNRKLLQTTEEDYGPDIFCDYIIDFMQRKSDKQEPFLAYYSMTLPHMQGVPKTPESMKLKGIAKYWCPPTPDPNHPGQKVGGGPEAIEPMMEYADYLIGRCLDAVEKMGISENTYIIFTCDNGPDWPKRIWKESKSWPTELGVNVPLIVKGPKVSKGLKTCELGDLTDIYPTLCDMAGMKVPEDLDGVSLLPTFLGGKGEREWIFSSVAGSRVLRTKQWLLEKNHESHFGTFWYCGDSGDGITSYKNVTNSTDPDVLKEKEHFEEILNTLSIESGIQKDDYFNVKSTCYTKKELVEFHKITFETEGFGKH